VVWDAPRRRPLTRTTNIPSSIRHRLTSLSPQELVAAPDRSDQRRSCCAGSHARTATADKPLNRTWIVRNGPYRARMSENATSDTDQTDPSWVPSPWEPPFAGTEVEHLLGALGRLRTTFRWKAGHLDAAGLSTRIPSSDLTLGGLLKHLALVEDFTFTWKMRGAAPGPPWQEVDWDADPDWDFHSAVDDEPDHLLELYTRAIARSREAIEGCDDLSATAESRGRVISLRWMLVHMIEEYARHCGHADLLRQAVDGAVGD
jgi:hypothetical protein